MTMLTPIDVNDIPCKRRRAESQLYELQDFLDSEDIACEVDFSHKHKNVNSAYTIYHRTIAKYKLPLRVIQRNNRLFILKTGQSEVQKNE